MVGVKFPLNMIVAFEPHLIFGVKIQPGSIASRGKFQAGLSSRDKILAGFHARSKVPAEVDSRSKISSGLDSRF